MNFRRFLQRFLVMVALSAVTFTASAAPAWEKIASAPSEIVESVEGSTVEAKVADGAVVLSIGSKTDVKVFTILGQLVAHRTLEAGVWRLPLSARGIYILKAGSSTYRLTI